MASAGIDTGAVEAKAESPLEYLIRVRKDGTADVHRYVTEDVSADGTVIARAGDSICGPVDLPAEDGKALKSGLAVYCLTDEEKAAEAESEG